MNLPQANDLRVDESKVVGYLLSHDHPDGGPKARFFDRFGFSASEWQRLAAALKEHGRTNAVSNVVETKHGKKYIVDGPVRTPDGRSPTIRTVWVLEPDMDGPRLITAYPLGVP